MKISIPDQKNEAKMASGMVMSEDQAMLRVEWTRSPISKKIILQGRAMASLTLQLKIEVIGESKKAGKSGNKAKMIKIK